MTEKQGRDQSYCAAEVRAYDRDRYLTALFAPEPRRGALMALYAFNLEIAKTRETVSEPILGQMRLQWWRETIDGIYAGNPREHEVAVALNAAVQAHRLTRGYLDRMIDAREFDLTDDPPADVAALETYAEGTSSALMKLALEALDGATEESLEAARHGGIAWAITGLLRAVPFHASQRRIYLPRSSLAEAGLTAADVISRPPAPALAIPVETLVSEARAHLADARRFRRSVPAKARAALLPLALAEGYLDRIERADFDVFAPSIEMGVARRQLQLFLAALRKRF